MHVRDMLVRYGSAEIASNLAAIGASRIAYELTKDEYVAAQASTWAGHLVYYGTILYQNVQTDRKTHGVYGRKEFLSSLSDVVKEFGVMGLVDGFMTRPYLTMLGTERVGRSLENLIGPLGREVGVLTGRLSADVLFYVPVIKIRSWIERKQDQARNE
jgi:hypothetical protein